MRISRPSPAMVVALLALVMSTTGTTIAATALLPKGSVGTAQIKDRTIALTDLTPATITALKRPGGAAGGALSGTFPRPTIATGAVTASALADGSVTLSKLVDNSITGSKLADATIPGSKLLDGSIGGSKVMSGSLDGSDLVANEPWIAAPLGVGWGTGSAFYETASYRKDRFGEVHLRGVAFKGFDDGAVIMFRLPDGYRPLKGNVWTVGSGSAFSTFGVVEIESDGDVYVAGVTDTRNVPLDGISFVAGE